MNFSSSGGHISSMLGWIKNLNAFSLFSLYNKINETFTVLILIKYGCIYRHFTKSVTCTWRHPVEVCAFSVNNSCQKLLNSTILCYKQCCFLRLAQGGHSGQICTWPDCPGDLFVQLAITTEMLMTSTVVSLYLTCLTIEDLHVQYIHVCTCMYCTCMYCTCTYMYSTYMYVHVAILY